MTWFYQVFDDDDINVILSRIDTALSALPHQSLPSVKIGTSDIRHGKARGVVFYSDSVQANPPHPTAASWNAWTWFTDHDYGSMFNGLLTALNAGAIPNGPVLPAEAALYARVSMTDMHGGTATLTLFWRA